MSEYSKYDVESGKITRVYDLEKCLRAIRVRNQDNENRIKYLEEENKKLKDSHYKDDELKEMKSRLEKMQKNYYRGFPISEEEEKAIESWKKEHAAEVHGLKTADERMMAGGCIGGIYKYEFIPTSIGVSGKIKCSCGAEFEFQKIE